MFKPLSLFLAYRYTRARKGNQLLSFVSWFSLIGLMIGVAALIVVLSVMNGFENELKQRLLHVLPHGYVQFRDASSGGWQEWRSRLETVDGVVATAPYIGGQVMISVPGVVRPVNLTAVDPPAEARVSLIDNYMVAGSLDNLAHEPYGIVVGALMARQLGVWIGDKVTVILPKVTVTPAGIFPRQKRFTVLGVFQVGAQLDHSDVFIRLPDGQKLYQKPGQVDGLRIETEDIYAAGAILSTVGKQWPQLLIQDWSQTQGSLFQAIKMEKTMVALLLAIVVIVAAFNIVSLLTMMVTDKQVEIAVLRTMGCSPGQILRTFLMQGLLVGGVGITIGGIGGVVLALSIGDLVGTIEQVFGFRIFDPSVYFITELPSVLRGMDVLVVCIGAVLLTLLATAYPAYRASRIEPAGVLKYV